MVLDNNIEKLLEKYDNGETSLKEEQQLKAYFAQNDVAPHLESYRAMFLHFANTKQETFTKDVPLQTKKRSYVYQWISVAAVIVIMFGIFMQFNGDKPTSPNQLTEEQQLAYDQTKEALSLLSSKFNEGQSNVSVLGIVGNHFDEGAEKVEYVNEFSKATNKILKKPVKKDSIK
ncbi:MAG: hypothetical protein ACSHXF_13080 [Aquaticitalea sp.]